MSEKPQEVCFDSHCRYNPEEANNAKHSKTKLF